MPKEIVLDIETQNSFADTGPKRDIRLLKVSLVGIYDFAKEEYHVFMENELPDLWPILEQAETIIGFNSKQFDMPVLNSYYSGDLLKLPQLDLYEIVEKSSEKRLKLDYIARGTLGSQKTGTGLDAIKYWQEGKIDKLKEYCLNDVKITKEVYEYGIKFGCIYFKTDFGEQGKIDVDFSFKQAEKSKINLTLPF